MQLTVETEPSISLLASPVSIAVATDLTDLDASLGNAQLWVSFAGLAAAWP